jgi:hypothetical protein
MIFNRIAYKNGIFLVFFCVGFTTSSCVSTVKSANIIVSTPLTDFNYEESESDVTIWGYLGNSDTIILPDEINGKKISLEGIFLNEKPNVKEILVNRANKQFASIDGVLYNKDITELIRYPAGKDNSKFIMPNTVKIISRSAFSKSHNLEEIILSKNLDHIYTWAFYECSNLLRIDLPAKLTYVSSQVFMGCSRLMSITIPDSLENAEVDYQAFNGIENLDKETINRILLFWGTSAL